MSNLDEQQLNSLVTEIVLRNSRLPIEHLAQEQVLGGETGHDSLALIRALTEIEDRLGITFPVEEVEEITELSHGELLRLVREQVQSARG